MHLEVNQTGQSDWKIAEKRDENINSVSFFWIEFRRSFGFWNSFNSFFYSQHEICVLTTDWIWKKADRLNVCMYKIKAKRNEKKRKEKQKVKSETKRLVHRVLYMHAHIRSEEAVTSYRKAPNNFAAGGSKTIRLDLCCFFFLYRHFYFK